MIEAIIAAGLAGAVTVLARGIHHNTSVNYYTESKIKERIRLMVDNRLREYKEQGKISDHEYISIINNRSKVSNNLSANNDSYYNPNPNSNHHLGSDTSTYILITMNKMLSRLDDIYARLEEKSLNNREEALNLAEYNNLRIHQNRSITKTKRGNRYNNSKNKNKEEEYRGGDQRDKEVDPLPINNSNNNNNNNNNNSNYEFNEIEELKKQIFDMISKLDKE